MEEFYNIPRPIADLFKHTGYVVQESTLSKAEARMKIGVEQGEVLILASLGGGQGLGSIWQSIIAALGKIESRFDKAILVAGTVS